jgi:hypothetical protein
VSRYYDMIETAVCGVIAFVLTLGVLYLASVLWGMTCHA